MRLRDLTTEAVRPAHAQARAQGAEPTPRDAAHHWANRIENGIDLYFHKMHTQSGRNIKVERTADAIRIELALKWAIFPMSISVRIGLDEPLAVFDPKLLDRVKLEVAHRYKSEGWDVELNDTNAIFIHP